MTDLIKDLRFWNGGIDSDKKMQKAAERIEHLERELEQEKQSREVAAEKAWKFADRIKKLEAALWKIVVREHQAEIVSKLAEELSDIARKALEGKNE